MLAFASVIDLRSDTVTRPTAEMRRAMAEAEVGDDVYSEDPTVNRLQEVAAERLGFEAALFVPSGVMANEIAIRLLTSPGQEVLAEEHSHVVQFELAGMAVLSGVLPRLARSEDGILTAAHVQAAFRPAAYFRSDLAMAVFENTHNMAGGSVADVAQTRSFLAACAEAGLKTHLDGARLWNASVALGVTARELSAGFDTAMVTLSKGLCAPAGSLLVASAKRIAEARRVRKLLGGGMRQVGVLAAAGLVALEKMVDRLADDHAHARLLGAALAGCPGVEVRPVQTNIVVARLGQASAPQAAAALQAQGVRASVMDAQTLRLVTHHDVTRSDCERAAQILTHTLK